MDSCHWRSLLAEQCEGFSFNPSQSHVEGRTRLGAENTEPRTCGLLGHHPYTLFSALGCPGGKVSSSGLS